MKEVVKFLKHLITFDSSYFQVAVKVLERETILMELVVVLDMVEEGAPVILMGG